MKNFLIFAAGAGVGGLAVWLVMRQLYEVVEVPEEEAAESESGKAKGQENSAVEKTELYTASESGGEPVVLKRDLYDREPRRTQYEKYSAKDEGEEDEMPEDRPISPEEAARIAEESEDDDFDILVINHEQFLKERQSFDKEYLTFYTPEEILVNEDGEIIDDIYGTVGYEFMDRIGEFEPNQVFVRNMGLKTDYDIEATDKSYYAQFE